MHRVLVLLWAILLTITSYFIECADQIIYLPTSTESHVILGGGVAVCLLLSAHRAVIFAISQLSCYISFKCWFYTFFFYHLLVVIVVIYFMILQLTQQLHGTEKPIMC